jgi:OmpA-OmpF porin, OOP family
MRPLSFLLIFFTLRVFSQNLVLNPDFESHRDCPKNLGQYFLAEGWNSPNTGTPDYFNDCSPSYDYGTEFNKKGGQIAHSGHAYMGIQMNDLHKNIYFEYIETKLISPLVSGQLYCLSLFVSLGNSYCALNELGAVASQNVIRATDPSRINLPYIPLLGEGSLTDSNTWTCIKGTYKAKGGENFITIGYFSKENTYTRLLSDPKLDSTFFSAYYFIDDVSVSPVTEPEKCICTK